MNKAFRDDLEIGEDEDITQLNITDFVVDAKMNTLTVMNALQESGRWIGENNFQSRTGKKIPVIQVIVLHKNEKGEPTHTSTTAININQNKQDANKLQLLNKELRQLSAHLQQVSEVEKKEMAREIHDELGQGLTIMKFDVSWLKKHMEADKALIEGRLDGLLENIADVMASFRKIYTSLHPAMLEEIGLNATLEWLTHSYTKSTNIPVSYTSYSENISLSMDKSLAIYRIVQECLTNILRYSDATEVSIRFSLKKNDILLEIEDNGKGFEVAKVDTKQHHGIIGMRERMYAFKGTFSISSVIGKGTQIKVELPV
jgi:signal transduction histidine kinase